MLETDVLFAYVKEKDWLKPIADELIASIARGKIGLAHASREVLHEIYYVSLAERVQIDEIISRFASLTAIDNLTFLEANYELDLLALALMKQYKITSIFDAYYAATALSQVPDRTIVSTDEVFDRVAGIKRIDPRQIFKH